MQSPGLSPTPKHTPVCGCGNEIELEMERDKGECVDCQNKVPNILKSEIDRYPHLEHYNVLFGYMLGTLKAMITYEGDCNYRNCKRLVGEVEAAKAYWEESRKNSHSRYLGV